MSVFDLNAGITAITAWLRCLMLLCWLFLISSLVYGSSTLEPSTRALRLQRPVLVTRETFVDQSLNEDEIIRLLGIRPPSNARMWINDHSRGIQLGVGVTDLLALIGIGVLSLLELTGSMTLDKLVLWITHVGVFAVSVLSEPAVIGLLGASVMGRLEFCSCLTTIFKLVGFVTSITMLSSLAMKPDVELDDHTALTMASSSAVFSVILVIGKILMSFEEPIQQVATHEIN